MRPVVLVSLDWIRPKDPRTSLGHASILARLAADARVDVRPVAFAVNDPAFRREVVLDAVVDAAGVDADIAIGAYVWNEPIVQWLLPALRASGLRGRIILGGPQISYSPPGLEAVYPDADLFVRGYGEDALAAVVSSDALGLPGVTRAGADRTGATAQIDLERLPSPLLTGVLPVTPFLRWETQRGCVYACSFCQHRESGSRLRRTTLASARVSREIELMVGSDVRDIAVLDPIFQSNPACVDILRRFAELGYTGRLSLQSRFEQVDDDFVAACRPLDVRLEFGLQTIHPAEMRAVGRRNDLAKAERVIAALREHGVGFEVSLIYGLPEQTPESFAASVRWCLDRGVPTIRAFPLMLLRGTGLDRDRAKWALVESDDAIPVVVASSTFSREGWAAMKRLANELQG